MSTPPPGFRLFPQSFRRKVREFFRPYAQRLIEAYFVPKHVDQYQFTALLMDNPYVDAKHIPVHNVEPAYVLPRVTQNRGIADDGIPVPPQDLWVGYGETNDVYLNIGKRNVELMRGILAQSGRDIEPGQRILDLGCAAGPMLRNLREFEHSCELWGCDIAGDHIAWCERNFPPSYKWATTTTSPHLPFEDHYFDLAYGGSLFSHMGEMADAWLLELARVIRPGGTVYITVVTKEAMHRYLNEWPAVGFSQDVRAMVPEADIHSDFVTMVVRRSPWMHAVYDVEFFKRKCERMFDVVSVTPNVYTFQWAFVLHRRDTSRPAKVDLAPAEIVVKASANGHPVAQA